MARAHQLAAASLVLLLAACGQSKIDKAEENFVNGCHAQGADTSVCSCVFDKLKDHYGKDRMISFDRGGIAALPPDFGQTVVDSAGQCRN